MDVLAEVIEIAKQVREYGADAFGPFAPIVTVVGQIMAAVIAILAIAAGKSFWAPPTPTLANYPVRICGIAALVGVAALFVWSKNGGTAYSFITVTVITIAMGLVASTIYLALRLLLCFRCELDAAIYVRGFRLDELAQRVLDLRHLPSGELAKANAKLPPQRKLAADESGHIAVPESEVSYFCRSGKDPEYIWTRGSHVMAQVLLFIVYLFVMTPLTIAMAGVSLAVSQPQLKHKQEAGRHIIEVPADILFEFGKAEIRPGAVTSLEQAAKILRDADVHAVRIEGHADGVGRDSINGPLSLKRAEAVRRWLQEHGDLKNVRFSVEGYGSKRPIEPNVRPDGSDNPEGRERNRRVALVFNNAS